MMNTVKISSMTGLICSSTAIFNLFIWVNHINRKPLLKNQL